MNKKKIFLFFIILTSIPFILDLILRVIWLIPFPAIADQKDWLGFLGSYLGIVVSILIVLWQQNNEKNQEVRGLLLYIKDILEYNCENYKKEYIEELNNQAASLIWCPNLYQEKIKLKNFELTREEVLLLYKNDYAGIVKLNEKIKETLNDYSLTISEENSFKEVESLLKNFIKKGKFPKEIMVLLDILINLSQYFYYEEKITLNISIINIKLEELKQKILLKKDFKLNFLQEKNNLIEFLEFCKPFKNDYETFKEKYIRGLILLFKIAFSYNYELGIILNKAIYKKIKLFQFDKYFDLSNEIKNIQQLIINKYDKKIF